MIKSRKEVQEVLIEALGAELDLYLAANGFSRSKKSLKYKRVTSDGNQYLHMHIESKPSSESTALARIHPYLHLDFPVLNRLVMDMVQDDVMLIGSPDTSFSQPVDLVIPKDQYPRWYVYNRESIFETVVAIRGAFESWIIPFLDDYSTINSLTSAYLIHDVRFVWPRQFYIYIAASYVILEQPQNAMKVLEEIFGSPGARRKYANAFEYVLARAGTISPSVKEP